VSLSYLEQLFARLREHALVDSVRGPGGGYAIARPLRAISVADVVVAVDGFAGAGATDDGGPVGVDVWARLQRELIDYLDEVTLQDLLEGRSGPEPVTAAADLPVQPFVPPPISLRRAVNRNPPAYPRTA
jgi:Rrf2 family iron-sulfur cluster assembly transcriptional regulator